MKKMRGLAVLLSFVLVFGLMTAVPVSANTTSGNSVRAVQCLLLNYGYSVGPTGVDGSFGTNTKNAVIAYQKSRGLTPDGVVGPNTWPIITAGMTLYQGNTANYYYAVRAAQYLLINAGYSVGSTGADGSFGTNTKSAVIAFQKAKGLTPDGTIGPNTWGKLYAGIVVG